MCIFHVNCSICCAFFFNQMRVNNEVISSKTADFVIDKITFEVGGKNKPHKQIEKDG